jgi:hypothetical protein
MKLHTRIKIILNKPLTCCWFMMTSRRWRIQNKNLTRSLVNISERNFEVNKNYRISHARVSCGAHFYMSGCAHFYTFVMSLSSPYTGRATLISICHVALISIQRSGYAHFTLPCRSHIYTAVRLFSFLYICHVALILIQRTCCSHFH